MQKQNVYWDVDDLILNSAEAAIDIINNKYNIPNGLPVKTIKDLKDWEMKSIYRSLTVDQLEDIFASDEFWGIVKINEKFWSIVHDECILNKYRHFFVTKGTQINLEKKYNFLSQALKGYFEEYFEYLGLLNYTCKSVVNMQGGIQIDDNVCNLSPTNARLKILVKNGRETYYNNTLNRKKVVLDNLYEVNDIIDVRDILDFNLGLETKDKL